MRSSIAAVMVMALGCACGAGASPKSASPATSAGTASNASAASSANVTGAASTSAAPLAPSANANGDTSCAPLSLGEMVSVDAPVPAIVDASGEGMSSLYERLARLVRGRATDHVRIGMYGDSNMTMDFITGEMRRALQKKFGDGGHGFVGLVTHLFYKHMDVERGNSADWTAFTIVNNPAPDRLYGFAMAAAESRRKGATTWIATAGDASPIGKRVSAFDVYYVKRPGAGAFAIDVDGVTKANVDANVASASDAGAGFARVDVDDAPHKMTITTTSNAPLRLLGATLERKTPSVIVDSLGVTSLDAGAMVDKNDATLLAQTLAHRRYDLVVFLTGTNEWFGAAKHKEIMTTLVERHRKALPGVSVLILSPPDKVDGLASSRSTRAIVQVGEEKKEIAAATHAAFWDLRGAMGGEASVIEFYRRHLVESDLRHFTSKGGALLGDRLLFAIWKDFAAWAEKHPRAGCDD